MISEEERWDLVLSNQNLLDYEKWKNILYENGKWLKSKM